MILKCELGNWVIQCLVYLCLVSFCKAYKSKSAPECPKSNNKDIWLLHNDNTCHKVNTQGPCGASMTFFLHPNRLNKSHGFCDCFDARMDTEEEISIINNRELNGCLMDVRSQIFVPERNRCYSAFDQGPCPDGKWLVLNDNFRPICAKHQCSSQAGNYVDPLSTRFKFSHSALSQCFETMTRGYCPKSYQLRFSPNDWLPKCRYSPTTSQKLCPKPSTAAMGLRSRCKPGSRRDYLSSCTKSVNPR